MSETDAVNAAEPAEWFERRFRENGLQSEKVKCTIPAGCFRIAIEPDVACKVGTAAVGIVRHGI